MAFPTSMLQPDERVIRETKLHWVALFREILYAIGLLLLTIVLLVATDLSGWVYLVLILVWIVVSFNGVSNWYTADLVLTNRRFILRQGLLAKKGYEIPVHRVEEVGLRQSGLQRMVGSGDLLVDTAGGGGRTAVPNVPDPTEWKALVSEARVSKLDEPHRAPIRPEVEPTPTPQGSSHDTGMSRVQQLEILARLHRQGSLTDEEFAAEKARVLKEG